jgi:hypothetical protein
MATLVLATRAAGLGAHNLIPDLSARKPIAGLIDKPLDSNSRGQDNTQENSYKNMAGITNGRSGYG